MRFVLLLVLAISPLRASAQPFMGEPGLFSLGSKKPGDFRDRYLIRVWPLRSLDLGSARVGDPARVVVPGRPSVDGRAARFALLGLPFHRFQVLLPSHVDLHPVEGGRGRVRVSDFRSNLPGDAGYVTPLGFQIFEVGATRDALRAGTPGGRYEGHFVISVIYRH